MQVPSHIEKEIETLVSSGKFQSAEECLEQAFCLIRDLNSIQAKIQTGQSQLENGEGIDGAIVFANLRERNQNFMVG